MSRKNKIIISVTGIILVLVTLIGLTYAYYLTRINGNTNDKSVTVSLANLELTYDDGNGFIEAKNVIPGEVIATKTFSVENTGDKKVINYTVYLDDVINTFTNKNDVKLTLTCTSSKGNKCTGTEITYPNTDTLLSINDIEVEEKHNYELKVEFIETNTDQSIDMNKELSGNIIIRDLKGTGSEITNTKGTNSVSVENAKLLSNYRIYGNSVQETRSGKNLLKLNLSVSNSSMTIKEVNGKVYINGTTTSSSSTDYFITGRNKDTDGIVLPAGTYTASLKKVSGDVSEKITFYLNKSNGTNIFNGTVVWSPAITSSTTDGKSVNSTFTLTEETRLHWHGYNSTDISVNDLVLELQIEEGSTATDYEAYGATPSPEIPSEIKSVGDLITDTSDSNNGKYKIGINTIGKNLITAKELYGSLLKIGTSSSYLETTLNQKNCIRFIDNSTQKYTKIKFKEKTPYTVSFDYSQNVNSSSASQHTATLFVFYYTDGTSDTLSVTNPNDSEDWKHVSLTSNSNKTISSIGTSSHNYRYFNYIDVDTFQLEEGSSATDYEPYNEETTNIYLTEPLRQIGNYTDYVDFKSGKVVRNIAQKKFTKDSNWKLSTVSNNFYVDDPIADAKKELVLCNYQKSISTSISNENIFISGTNKLNFQTSKINHNIDDFKSWISDKEIIINYILENKKEESIPLPKIDLNKVKYINIETNTNPSNIELDYVK